MRTRVESLLALLARAQDSALLRFSLGSEYLGDDDCDAAIPHLRESVRLDPSYSAAYRLLGRALAGSGQIPAAASAYEAGIRVAEERGDIQAAKEMTVFLRRLRKQGVGDDAG